MADATSAMAGMGLGMVGELLAVANEAERRKILQASLDEFGEINLPELEQAVAETLGPSAAQMVRDSPEFQAAQRESLAQLGDIASGNGLAAEDRAALARIGSQVSRRAYQQAQGVQQSLAARGMGGSGASVAAQMGAAQDANARLADEGLQQQAAALRRRAEAIQQRGALAGQMQSNQFGRDTQRAQAADAVTRYNLGARQAAQQARNAQAQQAFENQMRRTGAKSGQTGALASTYQDAANNTRSYFNSLGQSVARMGDEDEEDSKKGGW